jgi:Ca2+-binding RTX toxin-like protein
MRTRSLALAALCLLAILPATAFASTASTRIKRVFYTPGPAEANNLTIGLAGANYTLVDPGATVGAQPTCTPFAGAAICPASGIIGITVIPSDGADSITNTTATPSTLSGGDGNDSLAGGSGNDTLRGNKGVDTHSGGAGDDFIDARGDRGDVVSCGDGNDTVFGDASDSIAADCETVDRGAVPPPPPGPTAEPPPTVGGLLGPTETSRLDPRACSADRLGTPGNDRLGGTPLGDSLFGLQGDDVLKGSRGDDCLFGGVGSDRIWGMQGDDRLLGDDSARGVGGNDRLAGHGGDDLLVGGPGRDRVAGNAGNDRLSAGHGRNRLAGGAGKDRLNAANGSRDLLDCGPGRDSARADGVDVVRGCEQVRRRG